MKLFFLGGGNSAKIILEEMYDYIEKAYIYDKNKEQVDELKYIFDNVEYKELDEVNYHNFTLCKKLWLPVSTYDDS
jgi:predicted dinucleotide-utilizing enzyme